MSNSTSSVDRRRDHAKTTRAAKSALVVLLSSAMSCGLAFADDLQAEPMLKASENLWRGTVGDGFLKGTHDLEVVAGAGMGCPNSGKSRP
jgi:hypothetical protein